MLGFLWGWLVYVLGLCMVVSVTTFALPYVFCYRCRRVQNLRKKYDAEWALVTGASSGIGLAIARRLAEQGLNVVIAAVDNDLLPAAVKTLREDFKSQEFRAVGVDLSRDGFMEPIVEATKDILPQVVFLNAGYIVTGFFADTKVEAQVANFNCNAGCIVPLSHHFIGRLQAANARGCVSFTSSPAGFMPCPFSAMYGATKAFLTELACSLAPEVGVDGIDVMVIHPSPVTSNFYNSAHKLDALEMFRRTGTTPTTIADAALATVGRNVVCDQGYYSLSVRALLKIVDVTFLANIIAAMAPTMKDFKEMRKLRAASGKK